MALIPVFGRLGTQRTVIPIGQRGRFKVMPTKTTITIAAPDLVFNANELAIERPVAESIAATIKGNMLHGLTPSGTPLPSVSAATIERRRYRELQAGRGGEASAQIVSAKKRAKALRQYEKRFSATQGYPGDPRNFDRSWYGVESGLMASSAVAGKTPGGGYSVYFVGNRGRADRAGTSAVTRTFGRVAPWSQQAMAQPAIQTVLHRVASTLICRRAGVLLAGIVETLAGAVEIGRQLNELAATD